MEPQITRILKEINPRNPRFMNLLEKLKAKFAGKEKPEHLRRGELGERAAKKFLQKLFRRSLAQFAAPQMLRLCLAGELRLQFFEQVHF